MIVFWNGLGCLVIPVVILGVLLAGFIADAEPNARWPQMFAVLATSVTLLGLGLTLNRRRPAGRDPWGNSVQDRESHTLYFIPVEYWAAIVLVAGTVWVFRP